MIKDIKGPGTGIKSDCADEVLRSAKNAAEKGQGAFYTPREFGRMVSIPLPEVRGTIVDLSAGAGQLLFASANSTTRHLLALDVDPCRAVKEAGDKLNLARITGDCTKVYGLMAEVNWQADLFVLNPPFDLHWYRDRLDSLNESTVHYLKMAFEARDPRLSKDTIDSTVATMLIALDRMTTRGEAVMIANESTLQRLIFSEDAPHRALRDFVWGHLVLKGNPMTKISGSEWEDEFKTGVIYFAKGQSGFNAPVMEAQTLAEFEEKATSLRAMRSTWRNGPQIYSDYNSNNSTHFMWDAIREEWGIREGKKDHGGYNIYLRPDGTIGTYLSVFEQSSFKVNKDEAAKLSQLEGQRPMQLVVQASQRQLLIRSVNGGVWRVHPDLPAKVAEAVSAYHAVRAPLQRLNPIQSLGYLDEENFIECVQDFNVGYSAPTDPRAIAALKKFRDIPSSENWDNLYSMTVPGGDTFWQIALEADRKFLGTHQKAVDEDGKSIGTMRNGLPLVEKPQTPAGLWPMIPNVKLILDALKPKRIFTAGKSYQLRTQAVKVERTKWKPSLTFGDEEHLTNGRELGIYITDDEGVERCFMDRRHMAPDVKVEKAGEKKLYGEPQKEKIDFSLQDIERYFHIPCPPDAAECNPELFQQFDQRLTELESALEKIGVPFKARKFQRADLTRLCLHDGGILAWDTGLGKSIGGLTWPVLKLGFDVKDGGIAPNGRVLLIAPEHLHPQWEKEGYDKQRAVFRKLDSQETYRTTKYSNGGVLPSGWYVTSFTQLASNKVQKLPDMTKHRTLPELNTLAASLHVTAADLSEIPSTEIVGDKTVRLTLEQRITRACQSKIDIYAEGIGTEVKGIRCTYSPSLAELCRTDFDVVVIDEATRIKGDETMVGVGVRLMNPKFRLVLTATPIKNRLPDLFWLAWWAAGGKKEAHPRWPYSAEVSERERFGEEFLVCERNLTKERAENNGRVKSGRKRNGQEWRGKVTAEVCNVHRLWKLVAPVIMRRRKRDIGDDIVKKIRQPIRVPMGKHQARVYKYHMEANYVDVNGKPAMGAKLTALRMASVSPHSPSLKPVENSPQTDEKIARSQFDYTPKIASALGLVQQAILRGEQLVIFSSFLEPLDTISRRLEEASIPHEVLDGRSSQKIRGAKSLEFKAGRPTGVPVMLGCRPAMSEGHSWHLANNSLHVDFDWALDLNIQSDDRVYRVNSPKDVNSYRVMAGGTIDRKLESLFEEKGDSSELVLDGQLIEEEIEEVSIFKVLAIAEREFDQKDTIDEEELEKSWPTLKAQLQQAWISTMHLGRVTGLKRMEAPPLFIPEGLSSIVPLVRLGSPATATVRDSSTPTTQSVTIQAEATRRVSGLVRRPVLRTLRSPFAFN